MNDDSLSRDASGRAEPNVTAATWVGLFIALFGILIVRWAVSLFYPTFSFTATLWKESFIWLCVIALLFIIRRGERLPLRSIGLGAAPVKSSLLWGGILMVLCGVIGSVVAGLTHFRGGETGEALAKFPLWLVLLVVLRAGVVEELFYRGYAIERLQLLGLNRYWAGVIPLLIFGFGHVDQWLGQRRSRSCPRRGLNGRVSLAARPARKHDRSFHDGSSLCPSTAVPLARLEVKHRRHPTKSSSRCISVGFLTLAL
jgi:uncharacterized protein